MLTLLAIGVLKCSAQREDESDTKGVLIFLELFGLRIELWLTA